MPKPLCFTTPNGLREKKEPKTGPLFFKKRCASAAPGAFWEPWESWEREARLVWSAVRAPASIRMGVSDACTRQEVRKSLHELPLARAWCGPSGPRSLEEREKNFKYSPLFVRRVKTFEYSPLFGNGLAKTFKYTLLFWNREQKTFEHSPFVYNVIAEAFEYSLLFL